MLKTILISIQAPLLLPAFAMSEIHANNEFSVNYNNVDGAGKSRTSLTQGINYLEMFNIYGNGQKGKWNYNYSFGLKATDDPRNDAKSLSLTNFNANITDNRHTLKTGDIFDSFTRYTMVSSLKGFEYKYRGTSARNPETALIFGYAYPRWDSVWKDPETTVVRRRVAGGKIKGKITDDLTAGFNYVSAKDTDRRNASDTLYDSLAYSFDFEYNPLPGLTVSAERAMSDTTTRSNAKSAYTGHATRIEATGDGAPSKVTIEFENITPNFTSLMGSAVSDRRKFKGEWIYDYDKNIKVKTSLLWYRNNLDSQVNSTTRSWQPQIGASVKRIFPKRRYSYLDLYYKFDRQYGAGQSLSNHMLNASYRDRFSGIDNTSNVTYVFRKIENSIAKSAEITFNTSFSRDYYRENCTLRPSLNLGARRSRDRLAFATDIMYEYSLGLGFEHAPTNISGDLRLGKNTINNENGTDSGKFLLAAGAKQAQNNKCFHARRL